MGDLVDCSVISPDLEPLLCPSSMALGRDPSVVVWPLSTHSLIVHSSSMTSSDDEPLLPRRVKYVRLRPSLTLIDFSFLSILITNHSILCYNKKKKKNERTNPRFNHTEMIR